MGNIISSEELSNVFKEIILLSNIHVPDGDIESIRTFQEYLKNKQMDIEHKLPVFENIPESDIYEVMERFIRLLAGWNSRKSTRKTSFTKKSRNRINKRIAKEITIIEKYQNFIEEYIADEDNLWFKDNLPELCKLNQDLDNTYETNKKILDELRTKNFAILYEDNYRTTKVLTKKPFQTHFKSLQDKYEIKSMHIKQMIDIL